MLSDQSSGVAVAKAAPVVRLARVSLYNIDNAMAVCAGVK
jgi:hypothetical protein